MAWNGRQHDAHPQKYFLHRKYCYDEDMHIKMFSRKRLKKISRVSGGGGGSNNSKCGKRRKVS